MTSVSEVYMPLAGILTWLNVLGSSQQASPKISLEFWSIIPEG